MRRRSESKQNKRAKKKQKIIVVGCVDRSVNVRDDDVGALGSAFRSKSLPVVFGTAEVD